MVMLVATHIPHPQIPLIFYSWQHTTNFHNTLPYSKQIHQAALLKTFNKNGNRLLTLATKVLSGDSTNREGYAAQIYWKKVVGKICNVLLKNLKKRALVNYNADFILDIVLPEKWPKTSNANRKNN